MVPYSAELPLDQLLIINTVLVKNSKDSLTYGGKGVISGIPRSGEQKLINWNCF